jgi:hypothetical protein
MEQAVRTGLIGANPLEHLRVPVVMRRSRRRAPGCRLLIAFGIGGVLSCLAVLPCAAPAQAGTGSPLSGQVLAAVAGGLPDASGLSPAQATAGNPSFGITVIGSGFVQGSTVLWNGETRDTGFISSTMLVATIRVVKS